MFAKTMSAFRSLAPRLAPHMTRGYKVVVVGGAGGIGQPMSLLMTNNPLVTKMAVYDVVGALGVAADLSHCDSKAQVTGHGQGRMCRPP